MSTWVIACERNLEGVMEFLLKKFPEEFQKLSIPRQYWDSAKQEHKDSVYNPRIEVKNCTKYNGTYAIEFSLILDDGANTKAIRFGLDLYPHCCALHQLNNFYHKEVISQELLNEFIEQCISAYGDCVSRPVRLMMNFVEHNTRPGVEYGTSDRVPSIENPSINYPKFYKWAKQYQFQEQCFVNHNTSSIIHNVVINYAHGVLTK